MIFYTYLWIREDGTPYYVGKGTWHRAHTIHLRIGSAPPADRILLEAHTSEADAFAAKTFLISYYGRKDKGGILANLTDGGEGKAGWKESEEQGAKRGAAISAGKKGKRFTPEHKAALRLAKLGTKQSAEHVQARATGMKGKNTYKHSPETCLRMSTAAKNRRNKAAQ